MSVCMFVYAIVALYVKSTNKITIVHICCVCVCVTLGSALGQFHCWLGPSFYEFLIYSIYIFIVKSKNRIHLISSSQKA